MQRAQPNSAGYVWRALLTKHLEPQENGGDHHIYHDVFREDGRELRGSTGVRVAWTWNGRRADEPAPPSSLEKPKPEHMANIPVNKGQIVSAWVDGFGYPSDVVMNLHTDHPDEGNGNSRYHHSFFIVWQLVNVAQLGNDNSDNTDQLDRQITSLEAVVAALRDIRDASRAQRAKD